MDCNEIKKIGELVDVKLKNGFNVFGKKFEKKLDKKLDQKLDKRFDEFEKKIDRKLDAKLEINSNRLEKRIEDKLAKWKDEIFGLVDDLGLERKVFST